MLNALNIILKWPSWMETLGLMLQNKYGQQQQDNKYKDNEQTLIKLGNLLLSRLVLCRNKWWNWQQLGVPTAETSHSKLFTRVIAECWWPFPWKKKGCNGFCTCKEFPSNTTEETVRQDFLFRALFVEYSSSCKTKVKSNLSPSKQCCVFHLVRAVFVWWFSAQRINIGLQCHPIDKAGLVKHEQSWI